MARTHTHFSEYDYLSLELNADEPYLFTEPVQPKEPAVISFWAEHGGDVDVALGGSFYAEELAPVVSLIDTDQTDGTGTARIVLRDTGRIDSTYTLTPCIPDRWKRS